VGGFTYRVRFSEWVRLGEASWAVLGLAWLTGQLYSLVLFFACALLVCISAYYSYSKPWRLGVTIRSESSTQVGKSLVAALAT
jgi:hypothetical protein